MFLTGKGLHPLHCFKFQIPRVSSFQREPAWLVWLTQHVPHDTPTLTLLSSFVHLTEQQQLSNKDNTTCQKETPTMVCYNALTGRRRKTSRRDLPRKRRASRSSTVKERMLAKRARQCMHNYLKMYEASYNWAREILDLTQQYSHAMSVDGRRRSLALSALVMNEAESYADMACIMAQLDADLLDVQDEQGPSSYHIPRSQESKVRPLNQKLVTAALKAFFEEQNSDGLSTCC